MSETDQGPGVDQTTSPGMEEAEHQQAVERIKHRRRFHGELVVTAVGVVILIGIWASSEYHNAGGWPTQSFSQSSGIDDVWDYLNIHPVIAVALIAAAPAWSVYGPQSHFRGWTSSARWSGRSANR